MFGTQVSLNFKGEDQHKTVMGGIVTMILRVIMAYVCIIKSKSMINKENNTYEMFDEPNDGLAINLEETGVIPIWSFYRMSNDFSRTQMSA